MSNELLKYVGSQIRMFRKIKKLTIDDLAKMIGKSKSTVSKYESGEIAIDIATLYDIASALNTSMVILTDYQENKKADVEQSRIWQADQLYMYHQSGEIIYSSFMRLKNDEANNKTIATLYYKVDDLDNFQDCDCIYQGYMSHHENILNFNLQNCMYNSESVLINFFVPMRKTATLSGLISGLEGITLRPSSYKVVLSKAPLSGDELKELLKLSKDVIKRLRDEHVFRVDD